MPTGIKAFLKLIWVSVLNTESETEQLKQISCIIFIKERFKIYKKGSKDIVYI